MEVDEISRAARIQGGIRVPTVENELKSYGLTLRHFPQSMELATLGGMIATRSGGHFATLYTHIDDLVESLRTVSPAAGTEIRGA
ncbi:FAD-binding oxidoreductase [Bradyrhizobium sp. RDM4]|uniref:FAD-binding oxidoreductase n=1 Tax=Bradyrhizobium sp. RDM4 TaxID=3378765 RepID=UPI0038FC43F7